jgi:hypothetical protein
MKWTIQFLETSVQMLDDSRLKNNFVRDLRRIVGNLTAGKPWPFSCERRRRFKCQCALAEGLRRVSDNLSFI